MIKEIHKMLEIENILSQALDEINELRNEEDHINLDCKDVIIGPEGIFDSLSTATFILELENLCKEKKGSDLDLTSIILGEDGLFENFKISDLKEIINNALRN